MKIRADGCKEQALLRQFGIEELSLMKMIQVVQITARTCIKSTGRRRYELVAGNL